MLNFILGRSGCGKSQHILKSIDKLAKTTDKNIFLIVPEQFTFEMEQKYLKLIGVKNLKNVHIMGFSRIAHNIFKTYGGTCGDYADESVKLILMNMALHEVLDGLNVYAKSMKNMNFTKSMVELVSQFKHANIECDDFEAKLHDLGDGLLKEKSKDIALIYSAYDAMLGSKYKDELNDIDRAIVKIKEHNYFKDSIIFVDEFKDFTQKELELIKVMLTQASDVHFSLCLDNSQKNDFSLFSCVNKTYRDLISLARSINIPVNLPFVLNENHRFKSEELSHLEQNIFSPTTTKHSTTCENVTLITAENEYDEVDFVLSQIKELISGDNIRYNDIVIVSRELETYADILENGFRKYQIPFFMDSRKTITNSPIIKLIEQALNTVSTSLSSDNILAFLKCGLCAFEYADISALENYIFMWDIKPREWAEDFTYSTFGTNTISNEDLHAQNDNTLVKINSIRHAVYNALSDFKTDCKDSTAKEISIALLALLQKLNISQNINTTLKSMQESGNNLSEILEICNDYKAVWGILEQIINIIAQTIPDKKITAKHYYELFCLICQNFDMGAIPKSLDNVLVGDIKRIRTDSPKILFIIGANEKVFPYVPSTAGIYTNNELKILSELGIKLSASVEDSIKEEKFIAYKTLSLPSDKLYLSARKSDVKGSTLAVSAIFDQINDIYENDILLETYSLENEFFCRSKASAFSVLAGNIRENSVLTATLSKLFSNDEEYSKKLENLIKILNKTEFKLYDHEVTQKLFGTNVFISPTKIEQYHKCKFLYFCEHGLKLKKREKIKLNSLNKGLIIHDVLYRIFVEITDYKSFDATLIRKKIKTYVDEYIIATLGGFENKTKRFMYLYNKIRKNIFDIVKRLFDELSQSEFLPSDFEYKIGIENNNFLKIQSDNGVDINLIGTVDRIDSYTTKSGKTYIRVIDYKSGVKKFSLSNIVNGVNLQMFVYLMCLQNDKDKYNSSGSAGVLYMPAGEIGSDLDRHDDEEKINLAKQSHYQMSGAVLSEKEILQAMEKDLNGRFLPIETTSKAYDKEHNLRSDAFIDDHANEELFSKQSAESLLTSEQIGKLFTSIKNSIKNMADEIYSGNIEAKPLVSKDSNPCDYCSFKLICAHDDDMEINEYMDFKKKELFEYLDANLGGEN